MTSDIYNTTVNVNGNRVYSSTYSLGDSCCCCRNGVYTMNSCFGFGYDPAAYVAMGIGFAAGAAITPFIPRIFNYIGQGLSWFGTKVIAPAATAVWKGISAAASAVKKGVTNLWHKIFPKKAKTEPKELKE